MTIKNRPSAERNTSFTSSSQQVTESLQRIDTGTREFEYTLSDFQRVSKLIHKRAGIALAPTKQDMVYSRLARRLRAKGLRTFSDYLDQLELGHNASEWEAFVNALTTNLTSFFREAHHFDILADYLRKVSERRAVKIWCCAASTGEEAYSLAITACEVFGSMTPPVQIIASDLDTNVLAHARQAIYNREHIEKLEAGRIRKFFMPAADGLDGRMSVRPDLQRLITFKRINLLEANWGLQGPFDAIFCRNVMIYFDKDTQYGILERFVPLLRADGLLFAGHSESFLHAAKLVKPLGRTVYTRAAHKEHQEHI